MEGGCQIQRKEKGMLAGFGVSLIHRTKFMEEETLWFQL